MTGIFVVNNLLPFQQTERSKVLMAAGQRNAGGLQTFPHVYSLKRIKTHSALSPLKHNLAYHIQFGCR